MAPDVNAQKNALREQMRSVLESLSPAGRADTSGQARARLEEQRIWRNAGSVLFFAPLPTELDLWPLLEAALMTGRTVALPRFSSSTRTYEAAQLRDLRCDLRAGRFGIREPAEHCAAIPLNRLELVLAPGLAFDPHGHRLGRGEGFYDRMLVAVRGTKCGAAFDEQIVGEVPAGPQDIHLDCILTPTRWIEV